MNILLVSILFGFLSPAPVGETNIAIQSNVLTQTSESSKNDEERADTTLENTLLGTGAGLVAVGGIGAGVVAYRNSKPKDVPSKQIDHDYDDSGEDKKRLR